MTLTTLVYLGPIAAVVVMAAMIPLFFWMLNKYAPAQAGSQSEALVETSQTPSSKS
jgi:hypothetical protein